MYTHLKLNDSTVLAGHACCTGGLVGTPFAQQLAHEGRALTPATDIGDNAAVVISVLPALT